MMKITVGIPTFAETITVLDPTLCFLFGFLVFFLSVCCLFCRPRHGFFSAIFLVRSGCISCVRVRLRGHGPGYISTSGCLRVRLGRVTAVPFAQCMLAFLFFGSVFFLRNVFGVLFFWHFFSFGGGYPFFSLTSCYYGRWGWPRTFTSAFMVRSSGYVLVLRAC